MAKRSCDCSLDRPICDRFCLAALQDSSSKTSPCLCILGNREHSASPTKRLCEMWTCVKTLQALFWSYCFYTEINLSFSGSLGAESGTALKSRYCAEQSKVISFSLSTSLFLILNKEVILENLHSLFLSVIMYVPLWHMSGFLRLMIFLYPLKMLFQSSPKKSTSTQTRTM